MSGADSIDLASYEDQYVLRMAKLLEVLHGKPEPVVDIGPGLGLLERLAAVSGSGPTIIAVDIRLDHLQGLGPICERICAAAEALPFRDGVVPTIVSTSSFQVMRDQKDFLAELARVLIPEGSYVVSIEYAVNYDALKQTYPVGRISFLTTAMRALGLNVNPLMILAYSGNWVNSVDDGFSLWITGSKAPPPEPLRRIVVGSKVKIMGQQYKEAVVTAMTGWTWVGGHKRRELVKIRYTWRGRPGTRWVPRLDKDGNLIVVLDEGEKEEKEA